MDIIFTRRHGGHIGVQHNKMVGVKKDRAGILKTLFSSKNCHLHSCEPREKNDPHTVEPRYNEVSAKGLTKFVRYKEVSFYRGSLLYIVLLLQWGKQNRSFYRGRRYIEVRYIVVSL